MDNSSENYKETSKDLLKNINIPSSVKNTNKYGKSEALAQKEDQNWNRLDQLEHDKKSLENERYRDDTQHRKNLSTWAAIVVSFWLLSVLLILTGNTRSYNLSDNVLITLLGTTTLNVISLMFIVLNDIFNKKP